MSAIDYVILAILAISVLIGLWRGLVSEVLALAIWVAAFWVAWTFGPTVANQLVGHIALPSVRIIAGYGLCFVAVLIVGAVVRFMVGKLIWSTGLSGLDRLLGMLFGFVRGILLVSLMVFLVGFTAFTRDAWWQQSALLPQFQSVAAWLGQQVPADIGQHLHPAAVLDRLSALPATLKGPIDALPASLKGAMPALPAGLRGAISGPAAAASSGARAPAPASAMTHPATSSSSTH